ncbi:GNAT family N-acetyltransferase [Solibacillus sp. MA9]|uniref:GNAT family N-acetyltransferase n=1 Tax=Solibacillus palustris TaxID=2908203 RepID=A0ABS9UCT1_9BACL|nr:GNAT family N-acetyltransferase [Solibacillus sp. MA9]MCH7322145.1 GNAT family N-acetyltransferase [Solibacillus sp. MA9]
MFTGIRAITDSNIKEVLDLKISEQQHGFIEPVSLCLADAEKDTRYIPLALYEKGEIIGFSMYGKFDEQIWLDRYLIDERYQGKGLGSYFLRALVEYLLESYPKQAIYLSVFEQNKVAIQLYQKFGFSFTEELDENGEKIMIYPSGGL